MNQLDRSRRFSTVSGDSIARYYQDGQYYTAKLEPISADEAAKPAADGSFANAVSREAERRTRASEDELNQQVRVVDPGNRQNQRKPDPKRESELEQQSAPEREVGPEPPPDTRAVPGPDLRLEKLDALETKQLNNLVKAAGGNKFTGGDARNKAITWLLANTD